MSPGEQFGGRDFRQDLSESGKEIMVEGLRAFAQLINEQVGCPGSTSSASSDESIAAMDDEEFWDSYGANLVRFYNYAKYGYWRPEDGMDVYVPGLVDSPDGLQPAFILRKSTRWNPPMT